MHPFQEGETLAPPVKKFSEGRAHTVFQMGEPPCLETWGITLWFGWEELLLHPKGIGFHCNSNGRPAWHLYGRAHTAIWTREHTIGSWKLALHSNGRAHTECKVGLGKGWKSWSKPVTTIDCRLGWAAGEEAVVAVVGWGCWGLEESRLFHVMDRFGASVTLFEDRRVGVFGRFLEVQFSKSDEMMTVWGKPNSERTEAGKR